ncbi:MAG: hypothetical protein JRH20_06100 [Deltaproteobacteria bacterium]|nr:hypothetical protein [Deltaproteobacteria bacterium]
MIRCAHLPVRLGLSLLLLSFIASPADAKTLVLSQRLEGPAVPVVRAVVARNLARFGVRHAELQLERRIKLPKGEVVRFQQVHQGLPVLNRGISALVREGHLVMVTGKLASIQSLPAGPHVDRGQAERALRARFPAAKISSARLAVRAQAPTRVVWQLRAATLVPLNSWRVLVDATSGQLMHALSTHVAAEGWAYLPNPTVGELTQVSLERLEDESSLQGAYAAVQRCGVVDMAIACDRQASPLRDESYLWAQPDEPSILDAFSEVHTYYHVDAFHHWLKERFGFSRSGERQQIDVYVNFHFQDEEGETHGIPNAFFGDVTGDGQGELVFGQARRDFAYDADVIYHEFTHSVVAETSQLQFEVDELGLNNLPAALNEAFADLMSSAFTGDANVGEYAGSSYGAMSIRDLSAEFMSCPDDLSGESHQDSLIFSRLAWAVREVAESKRAFDEVLYTTMVSLHSAADIDDALQVLSATAASILPGMEAQVEKLVAQARLGGGCARLVPLTPGKTRSGYIHGAPIVVGLGFVPAGMQYQVDVPADAIKLTIKLRTLGYHNNTAPEHVLGAFIRSGQTVAFDGLDSLREITMSSKEPMVELTLDNDEHALVPGSSYFILPLNVSGEDAGYELEVMIEHALPVDAALLEPAEPDAGAPKMPDAAMADAGTSKSSSSGCSVGSEAGGITGLTMLLLLALVGLRRRRCC